MDPVALGELFGRDADPTPRVYISRRLAIRVKFSLKVDETLEIYHVLVLTSLSGISRSFDDGLAKSVSETKVQQ